MEPDRADTKQKKADPRSDICKRVLERLSESHPESLDSEGFADELHAHFQHLPVK
jgi:hypothetical protein